MGIIVAVLAWHIVWLAGSSYFVPLASVSQHVACRPTVTSIYLASTSISFTYCIFLSTLPQWRLYSSTRWALDRL